MAESFKRCAVYTRKSTEDGLEQEFNSLDAQYEACAAYALSQKHEGWHLLSDRYDDGGFSGGNMERPGLKRLLEDVADGRVDIILVYKIDRLTRSLSDFAKIVDVLDMAKASFVSITQAFNTTTSMGRLTLNMLLSFAQFEREVTGERIRDKIAASKRKGLWMGGPLPLGYDVKDRRLVINETEADLVRHIYARYLELGSVVELVDYLNAKGYKTKVKLGANGSQRGGGIFRRGMLYHLLANPIYQGNIAHKQDVYPGEHDAIVTDDIWQAVQDKLKANTAGSSRRLKGQQPSLLTGILIDSEGRAMTPSHASKDKGKGKSSVTGTTNGQGDGAPGSKGQTKRLRYRYYVTRPDLYKDQPAYRISAHDLEQIVTQRLAAYLAVQSNIAYLASSDIDAHALQQALAKASVAAATLRNGSVQAKHQIITQILAQAMLHEDRVELTLSQYGLAQLLGIPANPQSAPTILSVAANRLRHGRQIRLVIEGDGPPSTALAGPAGPKPSAQVALSQQRQRDTNLIAVLAEAHAARKLVLAHPYTSLAELAKQQGTSSKHLAKLIELSCLAPDIVTAILAGKQPSSLTTTKLRTAAIPVSWAEQRTLFQIS
ncbi:MAG: recombinase family protein [Sphingobium sp.]|nr:MAG: recombinase family protein [Sphingobium sp.]